MVQGFPVHSFPQWRPGGPNPRFQNPRFQNPHPHPRFQFPNPRFAPHGFPNGPLVNTGFPIAPPATTRVPVGVDAGWMGHQAHVQSVPTRPRIPAQVVCLVAAHLASEHAFASLASLNATCREIHGETLHRLFRIVYWNWNGTSERERSREDHGWGMEYYALEQWNKKRWDRRLESVKGARHIEYLLGPPLHRHFFVPFINRKHWIPRGLVDTLKAAITYAIDSSAAVPVKLHNKLEVYLCGKYSFGTADVVDLLDAIEPPIQDMYQDVSAGSDDADGFYTRLVVLLDTTHDDPIRWYSKQSGQQSARRTLETRTYPWLRQVDLVFCAPDEFDLDRVAVGVVEGLTMLAPAVHAWWRGDDDVRPELVVKGIDAEGARRCAELFAQTVEENKAYSCVQVKLLGVDLVHRLDLTGALYILHPIRSAYAALCIHDEWQHGTTGSACVAGLDARDRGEAGVRDVRAWVGRVGGGRVDVAFTEAGREHRESVVYERAPSWGDY